MTDPKVKQALLDLVDVLKTLTGLIDSHSQRLYKVESRVIALDKMLAKQTKCTGTPMGTYCAYHNARCFT